MKIIFHPLARGLLIRDNMVLVAHSIGTSNTFLPGGHIEPGERAEETLVREIKEEMNLDISVERYLGAIEQIYEENNFIHHGLNHIFLINCKENIIEPESMEKHLEFFWVSIDDLTIKNLLPDKLQEYIKELVSGNNGIWWYSGS